MDIDGIDPSLKLMVESLREKSVWQPLHIVSTAQERIKLIEAMPEDRQVVMILMKNREKLLEGLDDVEQDKLLSWVAGR